MGTITKYYPFIDEETKSILNSLMDESTSYYDFVQRLSGVVLEDEVPVNLAYLAAAHAWWCRIEETMSLIQEKYRDVPCIRPWGYVITSSESDQIRYHEAVVEAIEKAIDTNLDDWMVTELHLLHTSFHWPIFGDIPSLLEPLEKAKSLIEANPLLNCFEPLICAFEGVAKRREGYSNDSLVFYQRGQELAEVYDDSLYKYMNLLDGAYVLTNLNIQEALVQYEELYELVQDLEVPYLVAEVLNDSGVAFETTGEYDLAISSHLEGIKVLGEDDTPCLRLSSIYACLSDGQKALEWINRAFEHAGPLEFSSLYLMKAWALALLNRIEEALRNLDTAHSLIMKTGEEVWLGTYYHVSGVIEIARGDFQAALDVLEKAQEILERLSRVIYQNRALLDLVRAEILLANQSTDSTKAPGRWLSKLEKYAIERDMPGIRMQAALLKSEFYQNHGQLKDAQAILLDALDITDSLGVNTLRKRISVRIRELNQLLREAEVSSKKRKG
jgi:tetratricopeptide (TPR) repeat protein